MSGHLDIFTPAEHYALDAVANLHDAFREAAGSTNTRFCAHGIEDMLDLSRTLADAMDAIRADDRLLAELGRRQTVKLNQCGPVGGTSQDELLGFYRDRRNLIAAGKVVLRECGVNLAGWLHDCRDLLDARDAPLH